MNKKDIADIRKHLKLDNELLKVKDIFNVYIRQDSSEIYHEESQPFSLLDREQQELFMKNFKKVLSGNVDEKLFEVRFQKEAVDHTQSILYESLQKEDIEDWKEQLLLIVEKMFKDVQYEKDMVVTFIRGQYFKPTKKGSEEAETSALDEVYDRPFILCSINQTIQSKKSLVFDYIEKEFKSNVSVDAIINLASPVAGFLFPCFTEGYSDVNHILYSSGKVNQPDYHFIETVLNGEEVMTAQDDKAIFEEIVKEVVGEVVDTNTLSNVYEEINRMMDVEEDEDKEVPTLDYKDVERVLRVSGIEHIDTDQVETAFQKIIDDENYELKASGIIPKYTSKSIKIETKVANITISPQDLKYIKQVNYNGKRCVLIEVDEDTIIEGFRIVPETLLND
ncbi:DUF4317 domain-containing protein [Bacillus sp. FJAT-50079]|uniref:DUF4317 domain-containing protein n=1 Tax=Bacillus sp. FJAT-50079 TaxID=2833577 RepID=UPI001BC96D03|nr:DUF4317 domain-containing protein [Bacillus sp. FJAT-50079]MBS4207407.1 DUF4317 domain-containing protein [Bacillus sp. FJAT-50079]